MSFLYFYVLILDDVYTENSAARAFAYLSDDCHISLNTHAPLCPKMTNRSNQLQLIFNS